MKLSIECSIVPLLHSAACGKLLVSRIPCPVTRNRAGINAKIGSRDHAGVVRREKYRGVPVVARSGQLLHRYSRAKLLEHLLVSFLIGHFTAPPSCPSDQLPL